MICLVGFHKEARKLKIKASVEQKQGNQNYCLGDCLSCKNLILEYSNVLVNLGDNNTPVSNQNWSCPIESFTTTEFKAQWSPEGIHSNYSNEMQLEMQLEKILKLH